MYAIIETGGKQYKVNEGDVVFVEKLDVNEGDTVTFYKQFIKAKSAALQTEIEQDPELEKAYNHLKFTEKVITGEAIVIADEEEVKRHKEANKIATRSMMNAAKMEKAANQANLKQFLRRKGK